jgi:myo-inositol-1(or 4)-monophosphatase
MQQFLEVASSLARQAGAYQRERIGGAIGVQFKGEIDLVTEVDKACESLIVKGLLAAFPDHDILAEENVYPATAATHKWIIDPLDGTTNFAHGYPWFCVSIALEVQGLVEVGVVYHPMMDELFAAIRGGGAFVNGRRLHVSTHQPLKSCLLATGFPYDRTPGNENNFANFFHCQLAARGVRRAGAAALDLASVAAGRLDGYWECKLKPWDVAAGVLLVEEAGGTVTDHQGAPYSIYGHRILASNGLVHEAMAGVLQHAAKVGLPGQAG